MRTTFRYPLALLAGVAVSMGLVMVIEAVGHRLHGAPPADLDFTDRAAVEAYVSSLPPRALLFPLAAWILGAFGGGFVAAALAGSRHLLFAGLVGGLILLATAVNLLLIPHPWWMPVGALIGIPAAVLGAARLARRRAPA